VWHAAVFLPLDAGAPADGMGFAQAALLSPGAPAGGLGETAVADTLAVAADVYKHAHDDSFLPPAQAATERLQTSA